MSLRLVALVFSTLLATGCEQDSALPFVDLDGPAATIPAAPPPVGVHIGVAPIFSDVSAFLRYRPLKDYFTARLGQPVTFVQRSTYYEVDSLVRSGELAAAFICSGPYMLDGDGLEVLAVPVHQGQPRYRAVCAVPADSTANDFADLRGLTLGVTDPLSFTGRVYPAHRAADLGASAEQFFKRLVQVEGHDNLLSTVADKRVDVACVNSIVFHSMERLQPNTVAAVKVFERSEFFGAPPVVVSVGLDPLLRQQLLDMLVGMAENPEGREHLAYLGLEAFIPPPDGLYDSLRTFVAPQVATHKAASALP